MNQVNAATLLVVEDDATVRELLVHHLSRAGFTVLEAGSAEEAWPKIGGCDLVLLDWMLPGESGVRLLARLRQGSSASTPVLMLTARAQEAERVEGLEAGADDYLTKPFSAAELVARVRALLRRTQPQQRVVVGPLNVDFGNAQALWGGQALALTRREFDLLAFLARHPGRVFSRADLLDRVWGQEFFGTERTVDQHVAQLRALTQHQLIETVRGMGYRLGALEQLNPDV